MSRLEQFIYTVFDKLLLAALILVFIGVMVTSKDKSSTDFSIHATDILIGALVGLITGALLKSSAVTTTTTQSTSGPLPDTLAPSKDPVASHEGETK